MATLKHLKTFVCVAEFKKMSEAAKRLYLSQPTVSQIISDLEDEYQVTLFERQPKGLKITPIGELFLNQSKEVLHSYEMMEQFMKNTTETRSIRLGATLTIGNTLMSSIVSRFYEQYPDIDSFVMIDNTKKMEYSLLHNELDAALVEGIITHDEIIREPIFVDSLQLICSLKHPFAKKEQVTLNELRKQPFIFREKGSGTRSMFEGILTANHIPYQIKWECNSSTAIIDAVKHDLGIAVLSTRCIQDSVESGQLHACNIEGISLSRFFQLCYHKDHVLSSQMVQFIEFVRSLEKNL